MAGKGGVGKTTVGATIGVAAAEAGLDVLLVELEGRSHLAAPFAFEQLHYESLDLEESDAGGRLRARRLTPDEALGDYLDSSGLGLVSDRLAATGSVEVVATAAPGIRDLIVLGKIRQLEETDDADLIVVDAPAAGHAVTFLQAAAGLAAAASTGPVRSQADQALAMLSDDRRCRVVLVTTPEQTPVTEVVETAFELEDKAEVSLGPVVVNNVWMPIEGLEAALDRADRTTRTPSLLDEAARYRLARIRTQRNEIDRLRSELPLPQYILPHVFTTRLDRSDLRGLAACLTAQLGPGPA